MLRQRHLLLVSPDSPPHTNVYRISPLRQRAATFPGGTAEILLRKDYIDKHNPRCLPRHVVSETARFFYLMDIEFLAVSDVCWVCVAFARTVFVASKHRNDDSGDFLSPATQFSPPRWKKNWEGQTGAMVARGTSRPTTSEKKDPTESFSLRRRSSLPSMPSFSDRRRSSAPVAITDDDRKQLLLGRETLEDSTGALVGVTSSLAVQETSSSSKNSSSSTSGSDESSSEDKFTATIGPGLDVRRHSSIRRHSGVGMAELLGGGTVSPAARGSIISSSTAAASIEALLPGGISRERVAELCQFIFEPDRTDDEADGEQDDQEAGDFADVDDLHPRKPLFTQEPKICRLLRMNGWEAKHVLNFKVVFCCFDADGNEEMSGEELGPALRCLGLQPSAADLVWLMKECDADDSGALDFIEFVQGRVCLNCSSGGGSWREFFRSRWIHVVREESRDLFFFQERSFIAIMSSFTADASDQNFFLFHTICTIGLSILRSYGESSSKSSSKPAAGLSSRPRPASGDSSHSSPQHQPSLGTLNLDQTPAIVGILDSLQWGPAELCALQRVFQSFASEDGHVCNDRLASVLARTGVAFDEAALLEAISMADDDDSGSLDFLEFLDLIAESPELLAGSTQLAEEAKRADDRKAILLKGEGLFFEMRELIIAMGSWETSVRISTMDLLKEEEGLGLYVPGKGRLDVDSFAGGFDSIGLDGGVAASRTVQGGPMKSRRGGRKKSVFQGAERRKTAFFGMEDERKSTVFGGAGGLGGGAISSYAPTSSGNPNNFSDRRGTTVARGPSGKLHGTIFVGGASVGMDSMALHSSVSPQSSVRQRNPSLWLSTGGGGREDDLHPSRSILSSFSRRSRRLKICAWSG